MPPSTYSKPRPTWLPDDTARRRNGNKMSHLVAAELRRQIVRGEVAPGDTLPSEAELMRVLDVSRDTLREALRMLESESLIFIRRGRHGGAVVRRPGLRAVTRYVALLLQIREATVDDVHEARLIIERPAVALLADHLSPEVVARLDALSTHHLPDYSDPLAVVTALSEFDQAPIDLAGNKVLSLLSGIYRDIYAGELYSRLVSLNHGSEQLLSQLFAYRDAFVESVRVVDRDRISQGWMDYLDERRRLIVGSRKKPRPIDVTPFWRAEVASDRFTLQGEKLASAVSVELRAQIAEGQLKSGDKLSSLPDLATSFGISRPTLREALRTLERESLVDLRTGTQGGARIRIPSTQTAAQLAAIIVESQQTTMGDLWEARVLTEPEIVRRLATQIDTATLNRLRSLAPALERAVVDTREFTRLWYDGEITMLRATGNPAITVAVEIIHWIRASCRNELTADALNLPWVERSNRRAKLRFDDVVAAAGRSDPQAAFQAWTDFVQYTTPFYHNLGDRLILDMLD